MRIISLCIAALLLTSCGENSNQASKDVATPPPTVTIPSLTETPVRATVKKLPFDMPIMPGARVLHSGKFGKPLRRGREAIAAFVVKATPMEVAAFYEQALIEHGFKPEFASYNDEKTAQVWGVRSNGEKFSVTTARKGSKAGPGESQSGVVATIPPE